MKRIAEKGYVTEHEASFIIREILIALNYLHKTKRIVHRDLKPENILLISPDKKDLSLKLADFGFAKNIPENQYENLRCGSPYYMAPELVAG